ncbi:LytTR family DNA-binding domain-containing protein [Clostridium oceanicum]|uniref:Stage 0 sporulation protein A homolog n=1 Tax=Clostridium oceanicum TaxID=1543 RepID=A0ABP3UIU3_9CLOT
MDKIGVIIAEDEKPAVEELKFILSRYDFINIIDTANNGKKAYDMTIEYDPQVVFLDINMPLENGLDVSRKIKKYNKDIEIIFITAYEEYAVNAFEVEALDYILKPFDDKRIDMTINRLKEKIESKNQSIEKVPEVLNEILYKLEKEKEAFKKIPCEHNGKIILIDTNDIFYCYTMGDKTYVKTNCEEYITHNTLKEIESKTDFFRTHRSYIVNIDNIMELYSWFNGTYKIIMKNNERSEIPISRNNVKKIKKVLHI